MKHFLAADRVLAMDLESRKTRELRLAEIESSSIRGASEESRGDLVDLKSEQWDLATERFRAIQPVLDAKSRTREAVAAAAKSAGASTNTLYRWIKAFEETGLVSSLLRRRRVDVGQSRIAPAVEVIASGVIIDYYLKAQQRTITQAYRELERRCRNAGEPAMHLNTFKQRIRAIAPETVAAKREGRNAAMKFRPLRGVFPGAESPYAVLQIDHTKVDIILVDEQHRVAIGRPWITVAIDVHSRMVAGWYVSFDPPGTLGTGMCIANVILSKEKLMGELGVEYDWPCQGIPGVIHVDNAKEFRGEVLSKACQEWGIDLKFRKVKKPNYGGHVERLLGTLLKQIHALPGTTFSKPAQRENYNSESHASMTLGEFERWLAHLVLGMYHNRVHAQIGTSPIQRFQEGILGSDTQPGIGSLPIVTDAEKLRIDFLPFERRTIQPYGAQIDYIFYYHDALQRWIGASEPNSRRAKRKFIFRRDPRDISYVLFYDPDTRHHYRIPYRDPSHPPMSLWELRAVQQFLKDRGRDAADEETVFAAFNEMRRIEEQSVTLTRKARLQRERRRIHAEVGAFAPSSQVSEPPPESVPEYDPSNLKPFEEIEDV